MEDNEDEPEDVKKATPVSEEIESGRKDEKAEDEKVAKKHKDGEKSSRCDDKNKERRKSTLAKSEAADCCRSSRIPKPYKTPKTMSVMIYSPPCNLPKLEIIPRHCLSKQEYIDILAAPSRKCPSECTGKTVIRKARTMSSRINELAQPARRLIVNTLKERGESLPPEMINNLVKSIEGSACMSPEQAEQYFRDKERSSSVKKSSNLRKQQKRGKGKSKNRCPSTLDKEAVLCQYLMAEKFVKSILQWKCPIPVQEFKDISTVILRRLSFVLEYNPNDSNQQDDIKSQQMKFLADIVGCWISGVLFEVAEDHRKEIEDERIGDEEELGEDEEDEDGEEDEKALDETKDEDEPEEKEEVEEEKEEVEEEKTAVAENEIEENITAGIGEEVVESDDKNSKELNEARDKEEAENKKKREEDKELLEKSIEESEKKKRELEEELARLRLEIEEAEKRKKKSEEEEEEIMRLKKESEEKKLKEEEEQKQQQQQQQLQRQKEEEEEKAREAERLIKETEEKMKLEDEEKAKKEAEAENAKKESEIKLKNLKEEEEEKKLKEIGLQKAISKIGEEKELFKPDLPFTTFGKIFDTMYKMLEDEPEGDETDRIHNTIHRSIYEKFIDVIKYEDEKSLSENMKDVIDVLSGKIAAWIKNLLKDSEIKLMNNNPPEVESNEIRNWSKWIDQVTDRAEDWAGWIHRVVKDAENKSNENKNDNNNNNNNNLTINRGDWKNWTSDMETNALLWRRYYLETVHQAHHNKMMMADRNVVKTGDKNTKNIYNSGVVEEEEINNTDLQN